jgi:hypothetical protein
MENTVAPTQDFDTREAWLVALAKKLEPIIREQAGLKPSTYKVACGWPSRRGTAHKGKRIGECWNQEGRSSKEMFISPVLDDPIEVAETLLHELLHAFLSPGVGHRKPFSQAAKKVGLEGKPTSTVAGDSLRETLTAITDELGPYPHEAIEHAGPREKGRNLKVVCPDCGYIARTTAFWLDTVGPPICRQCQVQMCTQEELEAEDIQRLDAIEQVSEFKIPGDTRFRIRMTHTMGRKEARWFILDHEPEQSTEGYAVKVTYAHGHAMPAVDMEAPAVPVRLTNAESRQDALDLIEALRTGLLTYEQIEDSQDDVEFEDELGSSDEDWRDLQLLDQDEVEDADYEDGDLDPEEERQMADECAKREAWALARAA